MTESKEFALELFDTLSRRLRMQTDKINKEELREIWQQITDNSFDSRLQIFFDMFVNHSSRYHVHHYAIAWLPCNSVAVELRR